jgi:hypothetical protein
MTDTMGRARVTRAPDRGYDVAGLKEAAEPRLEVKP